MNLDQEAIDKRLEKLSKGWFQSGDGQLTVSLELKSFKVARKFIDDIAELAENMDHHPAISWQYKTIIISIMTHELGGLTDKDFEFASSAQKAFEKYA